MFTWSLCYKNKRKKKRKREKEEKESRKKRRGKEKRRRKGEEEKKRKKREKEGQIRSKKLGSVTKAAILSNSLNGNGKQRAVWNVWEERPSGRTPAKSFNRQNTLKEIWKAQTKVAQREHCFVRGSTSAVPAATTSATAAQSGTGPVFVEMARGENISGPGVSQRLMDESVQQP